MAIQPQRPSSLIGQMPKYYLGCLVGSKELFEEPDCAAMRVLMQITYYMAVEDAEEGLA